ncbi:unnamed protein product [Protopolystoma xenopodis]|uniref:Uncharacterized protein n=1 Tax=Protopolystoma xenopodis TaxID=117903 RepID=A0A448WS18_9PLAT|nr:unnamed protein product [Protopolystoma xenopodis]
MGERSSVGRSTVATVACSRDEDVSASIDSRRQSEIVEQRTGSDKSHRASRQLTQPADGPLVVLPTHSSLLTPSLLSLSSSSSVRAGIQPTLRTCALEYSLLTPVSSCVGMRVASFLLSPAQRVDAFSTHQLNRALHDENVLFKESLS